MPLTGISGQSECAAKTLLEVCRLELAVDATDDQILFAPVKLECFACPELQGDEGALGLAFPAAPVADEGGPLGVDAGVNWRCRFGLGCYVSSMSHSSPSTQRKAESLPFTIPHSKSLHGPRFSSPYLRSTRAAALSAPCQMSR
jgi:hypothetical protein